MRGAGERFSALALSPDGRTLAAGDPAGNVFLFDTRTRRRVAAPDVHAGRLGDRRSSPTARTAAGSPSRTTAEDGDVVTLMDIAHASPRRRALELYDYDRAVTGLRFQGEAALDVASDARRHRGSARARRVGALRRRAAGGASSDPLTLGARPELAAARHARRPARAHGRRTASSCSATPRTLKPVATRRDRLAARQRDRARLPTTAPSRWAGRTAPCASSTCAPAGCARRRAVTRGAVTGARASRRTAARS